MEFKRFAAGIIRLPCQIVRGGRRLIYRMLSYSPWQEPLFAAVAAWPEERWNNLCGRSPRRLKSAQLDAGVRMPRFAAALCWRRVNTQLQNEADDEHEQPRPPIDNAVRPPRDTLV